MKQLNSIDAYSIKTERNDYVVTLESLKNTTSGNPRFKAVIITLDSNAKEFFNSVYTFNGHYFSRRDEAKHIVNYHESRN